jgi:hypothetical protein
MLVVISIAADDLTGPKDLKRPLGLRSGTPECPAERAGGKIRFLSENFLCNTATRPVRLSLESGTQFYPISPTTQAAADK